MMEAVKNSIRNHLWYLTSELVVFGLFDTNLTDAERQSMAAMLCSFPRPTFAPGKPVFDVQAMSGETAPDLSTFITERSWLLFSILDCEGGWLKDAVPQWETDAEYCLMRTCLQDLKVVNDCAERCVKDITEYANAAKDSAYREDILVVATDHRQVFQDLRKQAVKNKTLTTK